MRPSLGRLVEEERLLLDWRTFLGFDLGFALILASVG